MSAFGNRLLASLAAPNPLRQLQTVSPAFNPRVVTSVRDEVVQCPVCDYEGEQEIWTDSGLGASGWTCPDCGNDHHVEDEDDPDRAWKERFDD